MTKRHIQPRNTQQRRHGIMQLLLERGEVSVDQLVQLFDTSEVTIRKDLTVLENNGFLVRRYGGAILMPQELIEDEQEDFLSERKLAIAKRAAERILDHNRIIIDSGTTTAALIKQLNNKQGLVVMTNSMYVANELRSLENEPTLLMTGGTWDKASESFQGKVAEQVLRSYNFDQLFIGADGIDFDRGTTTFNELMWWLRTICCRKTVKNALMPMAWTSFVLKSAVILNNVFLAYFRRAKSYVWNCWCRCTT